MWWRRDSPWPRFTQLFQIISVLLSVSYAALRSNAGCSSHLAVLPRVDFSLEKTQPYLGSLEAASIQIWSLRVFLCLTQIFQARDKVCQQMWSVCAASPGPCQGLCACYRDTKGGQGSAPASVLPAAGRARTWAEGQHAPSLFWKCGPTCKDELQELP